MSVRSTCPLLLAAGLAAWLSAGLPASPADEAGAPAPFLAAKTVFQTNRPYDPRIALAVDAVIVHRHGERLEPLRDAIASWRAKGYAVGRMFFADSDAANAYWTGKWDGTPHPDDVERDARGEVVQCAGVRPYMLPTEGWMRYLEEMTAQSIAAGADAVLPEEPLAHADTGYERAFQAIWAERYGRPWEPESRSPEARFLTAKLKNELYIELERRLAKVTAAEARKLGRPIPFVLPVHGLYSNAAAHLVAPLGTSAAIEGVDGYIGQVWTGPVNWALAHHGSPRKSFFASAYALYDYFVELAAGTGKRLWLLSDPVEDDPRHEWPDFERWYRHCVVAKLLFPEAGAFEVMPWPERIFLPGHSTGGGTPAPERYRIAILSAVAALQDAPLGEPDTAPEGATEGVGVAVADTLLWEVEPRRALQAAYGMLLPLIDAGVPASAAVAERFAEAAYLVRFRAIVLSFEAWKPEGPEPSAALARWVRDGGSLVVLGAAGDLGGAPFWWRGLGHPSPLHHLLAELGAGSLLDEGDRPAGKGWVLRRAASPRRFADPEAARDEYLPLVDLALRKAGAAGGLETPGAFLLRRGPFIAAHAARTALAVPGRLIDVFDPELPLLDGARLEPGSSGLYRDAGPLLGAAGPASAGPGSAARRPRVLHTTHRLVEDRFEAGASRIAIRGPAETPAAARIDRAGRRPLKVLARDGRGRDLEVRCREEGATLYATFPNDPDGAVLEVRWGE